MRSSVLRTYAVVLLVVLLSGSVFADGWTASQPSHTTLYVDTLTSRNAGAVGVADAEGFFVTGDVGLGTASPAFAVDAQNTANREAFKFYTANGLTGQKDVFTIEDADIGGGGQDESSVLKVQKSAAINVNDDGASLIEVTYTGGNEGSMGSGRQYYILGRLTDEGVVQWGVDLPNTEFLSTGGIRLGAVGKDCGATGASCFSGGMFNVSTTGDVQSAGVICDATGCIGGGGGGGLWTQAGLDIYYNAGKVGIGTTAPAELLEVNGNIRGNQNGAIRIQTPSGWTDVGAKNTGWSHFYTSLPRYYFNKEIRVDTGLIGTYNEDLSLRTQGTTRMTILNADGKVGIGTATPTNMLDVDGFIEAGGSDTITANPPAVDTDIGWKLGLWGSSYALGIASWTTAVKSDRWVSVFRGNPASDATGTTPDSNAMVSMNSLTGDIIAEGTICDSGGTNCIGGGGGGQWVDGSGGAIYYNGGNVGIGTASPLAKLAVVPVANGRGVEVLSPSAGNTHLPWTNNWNYLSGNGVIFRDSSHVEKIRMDMSSGRLGVGTTAPTIPLDVRGTDVVGIKYIKTGSKDARIQVGDPGKTWAMAVGWATQGDFSIIEEGVSGNSLYIKQGGNVGIGTSNPGIAKMYVTNPGTNVGLYVGNGVPFGQAKIEVDGPPATHLWVAENGARVFSLMSGGTGYFAGKVGIGVGSPARSLHVGGDGMILDNQKWLHWKDASGANKPVFTWWSDNVLYQDIGTAGWQVRTSGGATPLMRLTPTGNLGVGTTSPTQKLDVNGAIAATLAVTPGTRYVMWDAGTRTFTAWSSSGRYKENIRDLSFDGDALLALQPRIFNYKEEYGGVESVGLVAEEVEEVMPELVVYDDGVPGSVKYHELPIYLLSVVQDLREDVDVLQAENDALKQRVSKLEKS